MSSYLSRHKLPLVAGILMLLVIPIAVAVSGQVTNLEPRAAIETTPQSTISLLGQNKLAPNQESSLDLVVDTTKDPDFLVQGVDAIIKYDPEYIEVIRIVDKTAKIGMTLTQQNINPNGTLTISASYPITNIGYSPGDFSLVSVQIKAKKPGKTNLSFMYSGPAATNDTNLIGYRRDKPVEEQVARERLLSAPPALNLTITQEQTNKISWSTPSATLEADDFYVTAGGKKFTGANTAIGIHSDSPESGDPDYMTLEARWQENNQEMRLNMYLRKDANKWWAFEVRSYGGPKPGKWVYYHDANNPGAEIYTNALGQPVIASISHLTPTGESQNLSAEDYNIHFGNLKLQAFLATTPSPTPQASCYPRPICPDNNLPCEVQPLPLGARYCPTPKTTIPLQLQLDMPGRNNNTISGTLYGIEASKVQGVTIAQGFESIGAPAPKVSRNTPKSPVQTLATFTTNSSGTANVEISNQHQGKSMWLYVRTTSHLIRKTLTPITISNDTGVICNPKEPCPLRPVALQQVQLINLIPGDIYIAPNQTEQDNIVNTFDALELVKHLGKTSTTTTDGITTPDVADLNGDGTVNARDLKIIIGSGPKDPGTLGKIGDELTLSNQPQPIPSVTPITWEECIALPNSRIQESYPRTCVTDDGKIHIPEPGNPVQGASSSTCPTTTNYVCASDGQTYNNECLAQQKGLNWIRGTCGQVSPPSVQ